MIRLILYGLFIWIYLSSVQDVIVDHNSSVLGMLIGSILTFLTFGEFPDEEQDLSD